MAYWNGTGWEAEPPTTPRRPKRARRLLGAATEGGLITLLMFGLIAGTTVAARGGGGSSLSLVTLDSTDGVPHHGQRVTFDVSTSATDKPYVNVRCYQDGTHVYDAWAGFFDSAWFGQEFTLESNMWVGGGADCDARLVMWGKNGRERTLASISFWVAP
jgi:hypothetical protein